VDTPDVSHSARVTSDITQGEINESAKFRRKSSTERRRKVDLALEEAKRHSESTENSYDTKFTAINKG
jgi:hypothetical protein